MKRILVITVLLLAACAKPEPGPAEQIGKGIDQITKGFGSIDSTGTESEFARRKRLEREELARRREREREYDNYRRDDYYSSKPSDDFYSDRREAPARDTDRPITQEERRY